MNYSSAKYLATCLATLLISLPVWADDIEDCNSEDYVRQISGCTSIIDEVKNTGAYQGVGVSPETLSLTYFKRGIAFGNTSEIDRAFDDYDKAIELNPQFLDAYINRSSIYAENEDYDRAFSDLDFVIQARPDHSLAIYNRGAIHYKLGDIENAVRDFERAARLEPRYVQELIRAGNQELTQHRYDISIALLNVVLRINPRNEAALWSRKDAYDELGEYSLSIHDMNALINVDGSNASNLSERCYLFGKNKDFESAIRDCENAIKMDSELSKPYNSLGVVYHSQGNYDKAIDFYSKSINLNPDAYASYRNRGLVHSLFQRYQEALEDFDAAIQANPDYIKSYVNKCEVLIAINDLASGLDACNQAATKDPYYAKAFYLRGQIRFRLHQFQGAVDDFSKAITLEYQKPSMYRHLGEAYQKDGQLDLAIQSYDEAIELDPKYAQAFESRGHAYMEKGQLDRAIHDFAKAARIDGNLASNLQSTLKATGFYTGEIDGIIGPQSETALEAYLGANARAKERAREGKGGIAFGQLLARFEADGDLEELQIVEVLAELTSFRGDKKRIVFPVSEEGFYSIVGIPAKSRLTINRMVIKLRGQQRYCLINVGRGYSFSFRQIDLQPIESINMGRIACVISSNGATSVSTVFLDVEKDDSDLNGILDTLKSQYWKNKLREYPALVEDRKRELTRYIQEPFSLAVSLQDRHTASNLFKEAEVIFESGDAHAAYVVVKSAFQLDPWRVRDKWASRVVSFDKVLAEAILRTKFELSMAQTSVYLRRHKSLVEFYTSENDLVAAENVFLTALPFYPGVAVDYAAWLWDHQADAEKIQDALATLIKRFENAFRDGLIPKYERRDIGFAFSGYLEQCAREFAKRTAVEYQLMCLESFATSDYSSPNMWMLLRSGEQLIEIGRNDLARHLLERFDAELENSPDDVSEAQLEKADALRSRLQGN